MIFDYNNGDFVHKLSDDTGINNDGELITRSGDNMAINLNTGELHIVSGWYDEDDNKGLK